MIRRGPSTAARLRRRHRPAAAASATAAALRAHREVRWPARGSPRPPQSPAARTRRVKSNGAWRCSTRLMSGRTWSPVEPVSFENPDNVSFRDRHFIFHGDDVGRELEAVDHRRDRFSHLADLLVRGAHGPQMRPPHRAKRAVNPARPTLSDRRPSYSNHR